MVQIGFLNINWPIVSDFTSSAICRISRSAVLRRLFFPMYSLPFVHVPHDPRKVHIPKMFRYNGIVHVLPYDNFEHYFGMKIRWTNFLLVQSSFFFSQLKIIINFHPKILWHHPKITSKIIVPMDIFGSIFPVLAVPGCSS